MSNFGLESGMIVSSLCKKYGSVMFLKLFVNSSGTEPDVGVNDIKSNYIQHIQKHNTKVFSDTEPFFDSGFDLFYPVKHGYVCSGGNKGIVNKIDFQVKCSATMIHNQLSSDGKEEVIREYVTGYMLFPRSSLSKTALRLANSVGVIDSGYRGNIIGMFDCLSENYKISYMDRLLQICAPNMCPIYVELVENEEDLGVNTSRGDGGFGSTGK
jgi:hypothetical protein